MYPKHHVQIGDIVQLEHLKTVRLNGELGQVEAFNEERQRFQVRLQSTNRRHLFKGCNLKKRHQFVSINEESAMKARECMALLEQPTLENLDRVKQIVEDTKYC